MIEGEIIPDIEDDPDGDRMAIELLKFSNDKNSSVRVAVAAGLRVVRINDDKVLDRAINEMAIMATTDEEKYPAGRAALFLYGNINNPQYQTQIDEALSDFKKLVDQESWRSDLIENIPQLGLILK